MSRPTWDEYFKKYCYNNKYKTPCERLKVGCLLVKDNGLFLRVIMVFYLENHMNQL